MGKGRLEAFSDGVLAVIITIMVLDMKAPQSVDFAALYAVLPVFLVYVLSFIYIGIYWNNHHHMLHAVERIDGRSMWANLHLLFWLSLVPFVTAWMGENHFAALPTALYGVVLLMAAISYTLLQMSLVAANGKNALLAQAVGHDVKGKLSIVCYVLAISVAFVNHAISSVLYTLVAIMWFIPDRRIERVHAA
ncbi:MAG TPA: TMEM175 family protein [Gammaproteobacteria bacterium]